jgi:peptidoglycan/LPS O-acetylase OafA/YrhL
MHSYSSVMKEAGSEGSLAICTAPSSLAPAKSDTVAAPANTPKRLAALDFTKGALVLTMVLYHWMNYFVKADGSIYRYLRFLTPSFIFITGFLIAHVYLSRTESLGFRISGRLLQRGLKLLGIVAGLNIVIRAMALNGFGNRLDASSHGTIAMAYLAGTTPVAFSVLIPIAYLLILSGALLVVSRHYRHTYFIACAVSLVCAFLLELKGVQSSYLQLLGIGMLGLAVGHLSIDQVNSFVKHRVVILSGYLAYLVALSVWDATYPLQIVGVCLSLSVIYWTGIEYAGSNYIGRTAVLLGHYSLFGYIAQIVILQILGRGLRAHRDSLGMSGAAFAACVACTILSVVLLDRARVRSEAVNKIYTAVFC